MISRSGFTLFEAVVALAIISLVTVATLAAVGTQLRVTDHARHTTEAASLAEERMAAVRLLTASDLQSLPDSVASGRFTPPLDMYTWVVTSQPVSNEDGLFTISVQIDWLNGAYTLASRVYRASSSIMQAGSDPASQMQQLQQLQLLFNGGGIQMLGGGQLGGFNP